MDYVRKMPLLMGIGAALIIGFTGYASGVPNRDNIANILLGMVIFYITGIFIRSGIKNIIEQTLKRIVKKKEEEENRLLELDKENERKDGEKSRGNQAGSKVDLVADDKAPPGLGDEDFDTMPVADFIKKELR